MKKIYLIIGLVALSYMVNAQTKITTRLDTWNEKTLLSHIQDTLYTNARFVEVGTHLLKARNQILTGVGCQIFSGIVVYCIYEGDYIVTTKQLIVPSAIAIVGFGFEISGIFQFEKAGLLLNKNGIGIKIKF